ncbi:GNAT family N-acetyltransferase [Rummeliibacillus sp. G93]|uniref:Acetyltransferase n=1 Tax=Rummeliibacillus stabekisii TaxID=241244 RepID=A0A143HBB8_9BACL|nr:MULTISPECIES: GNAT family N-acetyltransferase [Rummeliibacillus]AMW98601.1 acetyltransferase [Rummeliibacillus stabekisii]MBB5169762.1 riboflavin biosynthesis RibT protein [Rummeliibacillus stabekisii]MCM3315929.1 GNAT family N-acetyltransferase [Rummeliibacillus stabekisii]UQW98493.1 GNAT family N-acetyltransferase [Rummeliibacillus sp. G93]GEL04020.1 protein RibT [Rummeliibacillus stabekisii]
MLCRYKKANEKIAMGLLSFMPEHKDVKKLQETICQYNSDPNWQLYLWKQDDDYIGLVGVEIKDNKWIVRHISVDPSHRGEGVGVEMIRKLYEMDVCGSIAADELTEPFIQKCLTMLEEADEEV